MSEFEFVEGVTPLSEWWWALLAPFLYLLVISGTKRVVDKGCNLTRIVIYYNIMLSLVSAVLLVDMLWQVFKIWNLAGWNSLFCDSEGRWTSGRLYYLLYINYLLKYVELGDTLLLALRAKPTPFLHVYHHAATLVLCLTQLRGQTSLQWFVVTINLFVHVVMYAFYGLHMLGINVWWKIYVTGLQIGQFIVVVAVCTIVYVISILSIAGLSFQKCNGDLTAATFAMAILWSYLFLFIRFFQQTYPSSRGKKISAD